MSRAESLQRAQVRLRNLTGTEFQTDYRYSFERSLVAYVKANKDERSELVKQFDRGEIDEATFDREFARLTRACHRTLELIDTLDRYSQANRPFAHPYYWAAFTCQGLA